MARGNQVVSLDKLFTKWIVRNLWENKTADFYASKMINLRIKNGGITARKWQETVFDGNDPNPIQWIVANTINDRLYVVQDERLRSINLTNNPVDDTDIGSISHAGNVRFIVYGVYTIILTWVWFPRVYDGSTLVQLTNAVIPTGTNPSFWMRYAWFTVINDAANPNIIRISRPITLANQERAYDWVWNDSETITFDSRMIGLTSTLNFLWIFTQKTIEYISRDNLTTAWWVSSLYSIPIASWDELLNPDTVTNANEYIFYMTASRRIKTINYVQGNPVPQVAVISEDINDFLQDELNADQSNAFSIFDKQENLVKFFLRSKDSTINDTSVIWDLNNQTRFIDKDKFYVDMCEYKEKYYAGSPLSYRVIQDEVGRNDDNNPVEWEYETVDMTIGNPTIRKQFRGNRIAGRINLNTTINWEFIVDEKVEMSKQIVWQQIISWNDLSLWIWWSEIGWEPIGWPLSEDVDELVDFERVATQGAIRTTGKKCKIRFYGWDLQQRFIIDYADITVRPRIRELTSDKV